MQLLRSFNEARTILLAKHSQLLEEQFESFGRWLLPLHQGDTQQELGKPEATNISI